MIRGLTLAAATVAIALPAHAQFEIEGATTASQEVEMELLNTIRVGSVPGNTARSAHAIGVFYNALQYWRTGLEFELENERSGGLKLDAIEWVNTIGLYGGEARPEGSDGLSIALFTAIEFEVGDGESDKTLTIGPAFLYETDPIDLQLNTFAKLVLEGDDNDTGFEYAAGASYEVVNDISVSLEAYGEVPNVLNGSPAFSQQSHYLGPAVEFEFTTDEDQEIGLKLGTFFGLTDATETVGVAANVELGF